MQRDPYRGLVMGDPVRSRQGPQGSSQTPMSIEGTGGGGRQIRGSTGSALRRKVGLMRRCRALEG